MRETIPDARIIVCLRHPVHMLHSFYNFRVWEYENGFAPGFDGVAHPFHDLVRTRTEVNSFSVRAADFSKHITDNLLSLFPREQCFFAVQERFWADTQDCYDHIHRFLGVAPRPVERKAINSRSGGEMHMPRVDYEHPEYARALQELTDLFADRNQRLFELLGEEIPEWRALDEFYESLLV